MVVKFLLQAGLAMPGEAVAIGTRMNQECPSVLGFMLDEFRRIGSPIANVDQFAVCWKSSGCFEPTTNLPPCKLSTWV